MGYFDEADNVEQYIQMAEGHDGSLLIGELRKHAPAGARVLELGMGPGKDLALLAEAGFEPTGSDASTVFVERYRKGQGPFQVEQLDAVTIETSSTFDVIYSNKVLHLLSREEFRRSIARAFELVGQTGLVMHSLWYGTEDEEYSGMRVAQHNEASVRAALPEGAAILAQGRYREMEDEDSLWVVLGYPKAS